MPLLITGEASKDDGGKNGGSNAKSTNRNVQSLQQDPSNVKCDNLTQSFDQNKEVTLEKGKSKEVEGKTMKENVHGVYLHEKVHIPDNYHESDVESESLSDMLRKIDAYYDGTQVLKQAKRWNANKLGT